MSLDDRKQNLIIRYYYLCVSSDIVMKVQRSSILHHYDFGFSYLQARKLFRKSSAKE